MGKKNTVEKEFVSFPDIAADTINVLLYEGKKIADAKKLLAGPTETIYQGGENLRSQYEDLCKYELVDGKINIMYLIANQSRIDGKMLLRKAGYTGGVYREQYENKTQNIFPVVEFVLYWGNHRWRSGRDIRRLFRKQKIFDDIWKYIDELKLHVFEMRYLPYETRKLFQSDMRIVVDFLAEGNGYRSDRKIVHKAALIKMIKVLSGEMDTEDVEKWMEEQEIREEDEITVCELFDQYERRGMRKGMEKGENRFAMLAQMLMDSGRNDDLRRAISDQSYREQLYMEVKLS
ncbi:MAG: Rpn family recombination-promoting nuclease/putative transposase [Lachnospiraceae bacterium]|nr:Rpn family recombination-promoting nuclease/putative transposase [Lachnospiraceae bacterium]